MPSLRPRAARTLLPALVALVVVAGACVKKRADLPFDPEAGHDPAFLAGHGAVYRADAASCTGCHGEDLGGGISQVSCSTGSLDGRSCHVGGPGGGHPSGWAAPASHGAGAKSAPSSGGGLDSCRGCHGATFEGGSGPSCAACHGVQAPHPRRPWRGALSHTGTDPGNAPACAECHRKSSGEPGCYNNTLCHGQRAGHPADWGAAANHGEAAKGAPGTMRGLASCTGCHGGGFAGGSAGRSCFPCHGWNAPHGKNGWDGGGSRHRTTNQANAGVCAGCHRENPGNAGCFNGTLCHGAGGSHSGSWAVPGEHGPAAKAAGGFASCRSCHGTGFNGGSAGQSCFPCHGWNAPHGRSGWSGGGSRHRTTSESNAGVCADCHRENPGTAGCFNGTLCHGAGGSHPGSWGAAGEHGPAAKAAGGFASCRSCHGTGFNGGSAGQSCFPCHGWNAPHGRSGWNGGGSRHRSTSQSNAGVCADCHRENAGTAGCFNSTLCHGD